MGKNIIQCKKCESETVVIEGKYYCAECGILLQGILLKVSKNQILIGKKQFYPTSKAKFKLYQEE